jgi:hypothetical protein
MPSTYSPDLRIELMANGGNSGTWGTITNTNLGTILEDAISGLVNVSITSAAQALTVQDGAADQARCAAFNLTTTTTAAFAAYVPPVTKLYVVKNSSIYTATVYASTVAGNTTAAGTGVAIPAGRTVAIRCDGTNIVDQINYISGNLNIGGNLAATGTITGTISSPGGLTGNLTGNVTGNVVGNVTGNLAAGSGTIQTTNYTITETGGVLFIKYGATNIAKIDSTGNLTVLGNVTAYGTV